MYVTEAYAEPGKRSKMELFAKNSQQLKPLTISAKRFLLDVYKNSEYTSV